MDENKLFHSKTKDFGQRSKVVIRRNTFENKSLLMKGGDKKAEGYTAKDVNLDHKRRKNEVNNFNRSNLQSKQSSRGKNIFESDAYKINPKGNAFGRFSGLDQKGAYFPFLPSMLNNPSGNSSFYTDKDFKSGKFRNTSNCFPRGDSIPDPIRYQNKDSNFMLKFLSSDLNKDQTPLRNVNNKRFKDNNTKGQNQLILERLIGKASTQDYKEHRGKSNKFSS